MSFCVVFTLARCAFMYDTAKPAFRSTSPASSSTSLQTRMASDNGTAAGTRVTLVGAGANLVLVGAKLAAGVLGHSQALVADAIHSLSDLLSDAVVLVGLRLGRKEPDADHHFGHGRIETLAAAVVGLSLLGAAAFIGYDAARAIYEHEEQHPSWLALAGAGLSVAIKEALYHYTARVGRRIGSDLVVANAWHHRTDALSSVAVLVGVGAALIDPRLYILDAYAAGLVSFFIVKAGLDVLRRSVRELSDAAPHAEAVRAIEEAVGGVEGVEAVHDLKVRTVAGRYDVQVHVCVDGERTVRDGHAIARSVADRLRTDVRQVHAVVVHVDPTPGG